MTIDIQLQAMAPEALEAALAGGYVIVSDSGLYTSNCRNSEGEIILKTETDIVFHFAVDDTFNPSEIWRFVLPRLHREYSVGRYTDKVVWSWGEKL